MTTPMSAEQFADRFWFYRHQYRHGLRLVRGLGTGHRSLQLL